MGVSSSMSPMPAQAESSQTTSSKNPYATRHVSVNVGMHTPYSRLNAQEDTIVTVDVCIIPYPVTIPQGTKFTWIEHKIDIEGCQLTHATKEYLTFFDGHSTIYVKVKEVPAKGGSIHDGSGHLISLNMVHTTIVPDNFTPSDWAKLHARKPVHHYGTFR